MKQLVVVAVIALLGVSLSTVQAQRPQSKLTEEIVEANMKALGEKITMDKDESAVVEAALTEFHNEIKKLKSSGQRPDRSKMETVMKTRNETVQKVLSFEDYKTFLAVMEATKPKGRRR